MGAATNLALQSKRDPWSYQVSADNDKHFWFRLKREPDRDIITDFFVGSVPEESAGSALVACYRYLGLKPKPIVVFRDIVPTSDLPGDPAALARAVDEAQHLYAVCGKIALVSFGARKVEDRLEATNGKYDLILEADAS